MNTATVTDITRIRSVMMSVEAKGRPYGICNRCQNRIAITKLMQHPLAKFCSRCEREGGLKNKEKPIHRLAV